MRVGVIGMGTMGRNHARIWSEIPDVELVAVCDVDPRLGVPPATYTWYASGHEYMLAKERLDAVSICTPTATHAQIAIDAMVAGCHVLVEKPIAHDAVAAKHMIDVAAKWDRILMVGHVERFNPAVKELLRHRDWLGQVSYIQATRIGPPPEFPSPDGLIIDLAVHDLDLMPQIATGAMTSMYCEKYVHEDRAVALMRFAGGVVGSLHLSWDSPEKRRRLVVYGSLGRFELDYVKQTLNFWDQDEVQASVGVQQGEPLRSELEIFAESVQDGYGSPVSGREGRAALVYAQAMADSAEFRVVFDEDQLYERLLELPDGEYRQKLAETVRNGPERV